MHDVSLLAIFLFLAAEMPPPIYTSPEHRMHCDVKQFVNTTDPIWTYKTTNDGEVICEVDEMESITQVDFLFRKLFLMRRRRFEVPLRGQFYHFQPDRMTITSRGGDVRFDLRVRNSSIHAKPHGGCNNFFYHHVKKRPVFPLYKPTCQRVLRPPK
ncbi:uncharacterized protein LOC142772020 isoform X4 [Rhipicephalus microplus]|uniref:uncharacterized protein LOC142772020 isoform X4 n=1 Tax=Rhipicephalus microplus TaxID=6941 RepID=UPI003F6ABC08